MSTQFTFKCVCLFLLLKGRNEGNYLKLKYFRDYIAKLGNSLQCLKMDFRRKGDCSNDACVCAFTILYLHLCQRQYWLLKANSIIIVVVVVFVVVHHVKLKNDSLASVYSVFIEQRKSKRLLWWNKSGDNKFRSIPPHQNE